MNLSQVALDRSHFVAVAVAALFAAGIVAYLDFPSREDPEVTVREAVVLTAMPGMAPDRVENLITRRVEEEVRKIPEVHHLTSSSKTGLSVVHVQVHDRHFDLDPIWQDLRNRMDDLRPSLPEGAEGPLVDDDFGRVAVATIAIRGDGFSLRDLRETAEALRDALYTVRGTERVDLFGVQDERIYLEVDEARLARFGLSPFEIFRPLVEQNVILPGGRVEVRGRDYVFEPTGNFERVEEIGEVPLSLPDGGIVYLQDLVRVERRYVDPPEKPVLFQAERAVVAAVAMTRGENILEYGERVMERIRAFERSLPLGYTLSVATFQPALVAESISGFAANLYQTIAIVMAVVLLFLGLRTGLVVGLIVPLTILASLLLMRVLDIPLQRVSVAALIISLGLLVDNGIVMAEDIRTRIQAGVGRREAAIAAGGELAFPLLSSSLTTVLVFLPLMLADHYSSEYTRSLSQVIAIALLSSWLLAVFVTPVFCYWFVPSEAPRSDLYGGAMYRGYRSLLGGLLRFRWLFLGALLVALAGSVVLLGRLPEQFFPASERAQFLVHLELAAGSNVERTHAAALRLGRWLADSSENPEIVNHVAYVGHGGPRFVLSLNPPDTAPHNAMVLVNLRDADSIDIAMERARRHLHERFPELRARVLKLGIARDEAGLLKLRVVGPERTKLRSLAHQIEGALHRIPGIREVQNDWENPTAKVVVRIDQARARRAGVTSEDVARTLSSAFDGLAISQFREQEDSIPVVLRLAEDQAPLDAMRTLPIYPERGGASVPLVQVAFFDLVFEEGNIRRRDLERTLTVKAKHSTLTATELLAAVELEIAALKLPPGYRIDVGGEIASSGEANSALFSRLPICFAGIVLLLVWQFNSVRRPLIILLTIPLSLIGAVLGLWVSGAPMGFMPMLGLLALAGIIVNNAIVLIDRIDTEIAGGVRPDEAVLEASVKRFRPIWMTTLTTILGLLPLMLFGGELWFGATVVISSGLALGTMLTLGVVPILYSLMFRIDPAPAVPEGNR